jgi:hypothetical protein
MVLGGRVVPFAAASSLVIGKANHREASLLDDEVEALVFAAIQGRSGEVCVTHRGDMSQKGVQFLVSIEDAFLRQIIGSPDRAHALAPCLLIDRLDAAVRRDCCVVRPVHGHHHPRYWVSSRITLPPARQPLVASRPVPARGQAADRHSWAVQSGSPSGSSSELRIVLTKSPMGDWNASLAGSDSGSRTLYQSRARRDRRLRAAATTPAAAASGWGEGAAGLRRAAVEQE